MDQPSVAILVICSLISPPGIMLIKSAEFVISNTDYNRCPKPDKPEFAFIGRSNVGKSSLINMLLERKSLAKTSVKPGKTQTINHYLVNDSWYLVDLPGYGYASVSKSARFSFGKMIDQYLLNRTNLSCTFVLLDARLKPQPIDLDFIKWAGGGELPLALVLTKADKLKSNELVKSIKLYEDTLLTMWEELPPMFVTSAEKKLGREDVLNFINTAMKSRV